MKTLHSTVIMTALSMLAICACIKIENSTSGQKTGTEIDFTPTFSASAVPVKAALYDQDNIITDKNGRLSGDFSVIAYRSDTQTKHFLDAEHVYYMHYPATETEEEFGEWRFLRGNDFYERFWPQTYALDFFAFMPYDLANSNVIIDFEGKTFSCTQPLDKAGQDSAKEFVYAFEKNQTAQTDNGNVALNFRHPFAAINFMLGEAHGNTTIHSAGLKNISQGGTFDIYLGKWTLSAQNSTLSIDVGKTVGAAGSAGIQLETLIGGPYLVMPQSTSGIKLLVSFTWNNSTTNAEVSIGEGNWQPGRIYTYKLNLGDNDEDILANVSVEPWTVVGYKNNIEVE